MTDGDRSIRLLVDSRKIHSGAVRILEKQGIDIEITELESSDYIADNCTGFMHMTLNDILASAFGDRRLLSQIKDLADHYERPVLIIEGEDPFFPGRTINSGCIQDLLKSIALFHTVTVIFTLNEIQTAEVISSMAVRNFAISSEVSE